MKVVFQKRAEKQYQKLDKKDQERVKAALDLFLLHPAHPQLHNHRLHGDANRYFSINASGDLRILYMLDQYIFIVVMIGTHSQLYH